MISIAKKGLGEDTTSAVSFLTALFELHGASLATATMFSQNQFTLEEAIRNILIAVVANLFAKIVLSWLIKRGSFARAISAVFLAMAGAEVTLGWIL